MSWLVWAPIVLLDILIPLGLLHGSWIASWYNELMKWKGRCRTMSTQDCSTYDGGCNERLRRGSFERSIEKTLVDGLRGADEEVLVGGTLVERATVRLCSCSRA